jgi:AAA domain
MITTTASSALSATLKSRLVRATVEKKVSAIVTSMSKEGLGKSAFALTAPEPLVYINLDREPKGEYIEGLIKSRNIYRPQLNFKAMRNGKTYDSAKAPEYWQQLNDLTMDCFKDSTIRTVVHDTGNATWELVRVARHGKLKQINPYNYGELNAEFEGLLYAAEEYGKILILVHRVKKQYATNKDGKDAWNGRYEVAGYSNMPFVANIALEHFRVEADADTGQAAGFGVRVLQNKINPETDGKEYTRDECTFDMLGIDTWGEETYYANH